MIRRWLRYRLGVFRERRDIRRLRREEERTNLLYYITKHRRMAAEEHTLMVKALVDAEQ